MSRYSLARERDEAFLKRYGGTISSEWLLPKVLNIFREDEEVYLDIDRFIEACAFGSAILGSVNEKGYATLAEAAEKLKQVKDVVYRPIAENKAIYDELYAEYYTLSEYFAKSQSRVMEILKKYK